MRDEREGCGRVNRIGWFLIISGAALLFCPSSRLATSLAEDLHLTSSWPGIVIIILGGGFLVVPSVVAIVRNSLRTSLPITPQEYRRVDQHRKELLDRFTSGEPPQLVIKDIADKASVAPLQVEAYLAAFADAVQEAAGTSAAEMFAPFLERYRGSFDTTRYQPPGE